MPRTKTHYFTPEPSFLTTGEKWSYIRQGRVEPERTHAVWSYGLWLHDSSPVGANFPAHAIHLGYSCEMPQF